MTTVITPSATAELRVEEFTGAPSNNSTGLALSELWYYQGVALTCGVLNDITVTRITRIHCMLNVDGIPKSAYAISEEALRDTPRESLVEMIMAAMTQNLAKQLYSTTRRAP